MFVEIKVAHAIDEYKLKKIKELKIPVIEIDLSDFIDKMFDKNLNEILSAMLIRVFI